MKTQVLHDQVTKSYVDKKFKQVDTHFVQVDKRFKQVDAHFEQIEEKFEQVDKRFDGMMNKLDTIIGKLETLEQENTIGAYQTRNLEVALEDQAKRITKIEKHLSL